MKILHDILNDVWQTAKKHLLTETVDYDQMIADFGQLADVKYKGNKFAADVCLAAMHEIERRDMSESTRTV